MHSNEQNEVVQLLRSINNRLANLTPTVDEMTAELSQEAKQAILYKMVENTSMADILHLEATDPTLIALRKEREEREMQAKVELAKLAGATHDDLYDRVAAQFAVAKKKVEAQ